MTPVIQGGITVSGIVSPKENSLETNPYIVAIVVNTLPSAAHICPRRACQFSGHVQFARVFPLTGPVVFWQTSE